MFEDPVPRLKKRRLDNRKRLLLQAGVAPGNSLPVANVSRRTSVIPVVPPERTRSRLLGDNRLPRRPAAERTRRLPIARSSLAASAESVATGQCPTNPAIVELAQITSVATSLGARRVCEQAFAYSQTHPADDVDQGCPDSHDRQCESRVSDSRISLLPRAGEGPGMRETVMTFIIRGISTVMTVSWARTEHRPEARQTTRPAHPASSVPAAG